MAFGPNCKIGALSRHDFFFPHPSISFFTLLIHHLMRVVWLSPNLIHYSTKLVDDRWGTGVSTPLQRPIPWRWEYPGVAYEWRAESRLFRKLHPLHGLPVDWTKKPWEARGPSPTITWPRHSQDNIGDNTTQAHQTKTQMSEHRQR